MININLWKNDWYPQYMENAKDSFGENTSDDAKAIASAIMAAGAFIAESLDHGIGIESENGDNLVGAILDIVRSMPED